MTTPHTLHNPVHEELRQRVAVFRYGVIAEIVQQPAGTPGLHAMMVEKAQREYEIPGTERQRIATETIRGWVRDYRRGGFDALKPRPRADIGSSRSIPATVVDLLCETKEEKPSLSIPQLIKTVRDEHAEQAPADLPLPHSTVHRLLARRGLMQKPSDEPTAKDRRRFAFRDGRPLDVRRHARATRDARWPQAEGLPHRLLGRRHARDPARRVQGVRGCRCVPHRREARGRARPHARRRGLRGRRRAPRAQRHPALRRFPQAQGPQRRGAAPG